MRNLLDEIARLWCIHMHTGVMWPFRGRYQCRICLREYTVAFEAGAADKFEREGRPLEGAIAVGRA